MKQPTPMDPGTEFDPTIDPYYVGPDDVARGLASFRTETADQINRGLDANPDDAAEATDLSSITGAPAPWTLSNLDQQKDQIKKFAAQQLVLNNPDLVTYLQSHPMAASVSNDDWANLDKFTKESSGGMLKSLTAPVDRVAESAWSSAVEGFKAGWGDEPLGQEAGEIASRAFNPETQRLGWATSSAGWLVLEAVSRAAAAGMGGVAGAVTGAARQAGTEVAGEAGGREAEAMAQWGMMRGDMPLHAPEVGAKPPPAIEALEAGKQWLDHELEPPAGVHPLIDRAKAEVNATAVDKLEQDLANAMASTTRERSPEMFGKLTQQLYGDSTIGIHSDAVLGLYGDKAPLPDDGLLGWVPDIESKLMAARDIGSDIEIPIRDWIARVDPQVAKGLHDDIRIWPGGITAREAGEEVQPKAMVDAPLAAVRGSSGLEPMFSLGDRKLSLIKGVTEDNQFTEQFGGKLETLNMMDENGKHVGDIEIAPGADRTLYVNMINGVGGLWANSFGPALMMDLKRQIKALYPDYNYITGHRVSGAREGANDFGPMPLPKVKLSVDDPSLEEYNRGRDILANGWHRYGNTSLLAKDAASVEWTPEQVKFGEAAMDELQRITGKKVGIEPTAGLYSEKAGSWAGGAYVPNRGAPPTILLDLLRDDVTGTGRHEAVHFLRGYNFFTDKEWSTLESAAKTKGWADRYGINDRYAHATDGQRTEESIAEAFREWAGQAPEVRPKTGVGAVFQKIMDLFDTIKTKLGFGPEATWEDVFAKIHSGEVGQRPAGEPRTAGAFDIRESIEGRDNLQAQSVGLDRKTFDKLMAGLDKRHQEDLEAATKRAAKEETHRQTKEWKANRVEIAKEVGAEIRQRPDVAADQFLGSGELFGKKLQQRYTLREEDLTPEQKAALPDHYYSKNGLPVDQVAGMFGYGSGDEMVQRLGALESMKRTPEGGRMQPMDFMHQIIGAETDRRMEMRYGKLEDNIMDEAKDTALSETNINLLHEQLMATAMKAGVTIADKEVMKSAAKDVINSMRAYGINTYKLMQDMGKSAKIAEKALVSGDFATATQALQRQTLGAMVAAEGRTVEKEVAKFDKTTKRLAKRVQPSMDPEYTNWVHQIMAQIGKKVQRSSDDLQREIDASTSKTLQDFVQNKTQWLQAMPVWDQLYDRKWAKSYKELSVPEFRSVRDSIETIAHNGREERKLIKAGDEADREVKKAEMIQSIERFKASGANLKGGSTIASKVPRAMLAKTLAMENILNRWDRFDVNGPWKQYVLRDLVDGVNQSDAWKKEFGKKLGALKDIDDMNRNVPNDLFKSPERYGDHLLTMNREALHSIMLNVGNKSNLTKMAKGWGLKPDAIMGWVQKNATKADWDRVQAIWDIFEEAKDRSDTMYRSISGVPAQRIQSVPVQTPHGTYRGGYYPMIYHDLFEGTSRKLMGSAGLMGEGFEGFDRAMPGAGYENDRTGYSAPTALTLNQMPNRLAQMIHNTAVRPAVLNAVKVFKDPEIRAAIQTHYGKEYVDQLIPYLRGVANASNAAMHDAGVLGSFSEFMRQNLITALVGLNPGTVLKHGPTALGLSIKEVGAMPLLKAVRSMFTINEETGDSNYRFAMNNSLELQRRGRNWQENLYGATGELQAGSKYGQLRQTIMELSSKPVALSDLMSAVPTWLARYDQARGEGKSHGDAVYEADYSVRRAHGSTAITNRPLVTQQISPWFTSVYNFFNDIFNRQLETVWRAGEALDLAKEGNHKSAMAMGATVATGVFAYAIWPAIVEEYVSPQQSSPDESWGKRAAKSILYTEGATMPFVREFANALLQGKEPEVGLFSTEGKQLFDVWRDLGKKQAFNTQHSEKIIRDASNFAGALTGVPDQIGKVGSAAYGVSQGIERPRGPWGWLVLGRYGTLKGHSATLGDYMAGRSLPDR
jgi:hypothetical protein